MAKSKAKAASRRASEQSLLRGPKVDWSDPVPENGRIYVWVEKLPNEPNSHGRYMMVPDEHLKIRPDLMRIAQQEHSEFALSLESEKTV